MTDVDIKGLVERLRMVKGPDCHTAANLLLEALAYKQKVSDAVEDAFGLQGGHTLHRFIIPKPKPDPLVEVIAEATAKSSICENDFAANIRTALDALGLEIREKG
jgi:hypothetical protein